jgi:hypothetical protein
MWSFEIMSAGILVLALATVLLLVFLFRKTRTKDDIPLWLSSALVGIILGAAGAAALASGLGYKLVAEQRGGSAAPSVIAPSGPVPTPGAPGGPIGMGMGPGMGMAMSPGGMGGGMGGGMAVVRGPSPKRQLTTFVRKLELLTGDIAIQLTTEQSTVLGQALREIANAETMTDEEAKASYEKLLAILDESQKAKQDAIGLPFRRGVGGGFGGAGGPPPVADANPFADEEHAKALHQLQSRLGATENRSSEPQSHGDAQE